jgi:hypothetical protein
VPARARSPWPAALVGFALACGGAACRRAPAAPAAPPRLEVPVPAPADEPHLPCLDVGGLRACWRDAREAVVVPRPAPARPASSPLGWRCAFPGRARLCVDRRADAPAFTCVGDRCTQAHARRPDDGEWTCVDSAGAVVCESAGRAAGVAPAPADSAWACGARRGAARAARSLRAAGEADDGGATRICVDFSPDVPDGDLAGWRCRSENGPSPSRVCERGTSPGALAVTCDAGRPCVDGALCAGGRCVPARPAPSCWLDDDCPGGACRFGTCREEPSP